MVTQTKPIELYSFPTPNGKKITVALEEMEVPYTHHLVHIGQDDQFKPEFLAISPNNKIPAIIDPEGPDGKPISVFESGAILKYLATKFSKFYPSDLRAQTKVDEWLFWQMGGFGPMLGQANHFRRFPDEKIPYALDRYNVESQRLFGVLNKQLADNDFVAGDISIADFAILAWSNGYENYGVDLADVPHFADWNKRMNARPLTLKGMNAVQM